MRGANLGRLIFFAVLALLLLLEAVATQLGLSPAAERTRLFILIALDAVGGVGALLCVIALLGNRSLAKIGVPLTTFGFMAYGLYQIISALTQLAPQWRIAIVMVGLVYLLIGIAAWFVGRSLLAPPPNNAT
jgi:peptidoglycan/LPS O-acetylase OafA/YrhL